MFLGMYFAILILLQQFFYGMNVSLFRCDINLSSLFVMGRVSLHFSIFHVLFYFYFYFNICFNFINIFYVIIINIHIAHVGRSNMWNKL